MIDNMIIIVTRHTIAGGGPEEVAETLVHRVGGRAVAMCHHATRGGRLQHNTMQLDLGKKKIR